MDVSDNRIPVLAVAGPTASGKTSLSIALAKHFGAEIISCDSMQIYKDLRISTAKPDEAEMDGVRHHLLDFLSPDEPFSVADYCAMAKNCIEDIHARGKRVILCGGTGLYMQSLLTNIDFTGDGADPAFREQMQKLAAEEGNEKVWQALLTVDPEGAETLHPNNLGRVIRALEVYRSTGLTIAQQHEKSRSNPSPYKSFILCLDFHDRQKLYDRIHQRVDKMLSEGLEAEARAFYEKYGDADGTARQAIGCKEFLPYLSGEATMQEAVESIKKETRHYAKRQLTWFRRMQGVEFLYADETDDLVRTAIEKVEASGLFR